MTYSIGEIEELTGLKAHILRYWEEVIPGFAPKKDLGGRRVYTDRDLDQILRLKFLIQEKKYTIEGARDEFLRDGITYENNANIMDSIREIRQELSQLYLTVRKYR